MDAGQSTFVEPMRSKIVRRILYGVIFVNGIFLATRPGASGWRIVAIVVMLVVLLSGAYWSRRQRRQLARMLAEANGLCCPWCRFNLNGLGESGRCPECGEPFVAAEVRKHWKWAMSYGHTF